MGTRKIPILLERVWEGQGPQCCGEGLQGPLQLVLFEQGDGVRT